MVAAKRNEQRRQCQRKCMLARQKRLMVRGVCFHRNKHGNVVVG